MSIQCHRYKSSQNLSSVVKYLLFATVLCFVITIFTGCHSPNKHPADMVQETLTDVSRDSTEITLPAETTFPEESTVETQNESVRWKPGNEAPLSFESVRLENGDRTLNSTNHYNAFVYCYYPVFSGSAAAEVINQDVLSIAEAFAYTYTRSEIQEHHSAFGMTYAFSHIGYIEPTYNGPGVLSILLDYNGFWGEDHIYEGGYAGYVYSLATGERLTLTELTGLPEAELLEILQKEAQSCLDAYLQRMRNLEITEKSQVQMDALTLDDFGFYITEDGQIQVTLNGIHLRKAEPARGYWVSFRFPIDYCIL